VKTTAYICGPLTELEEHTRETAKRFYEHLADTCERVLGIRAFVPHEHYDPIAHAGFTPPEVYEAEESQVREKSSLLIVVTIFGPSWGGGIEVQIANQHSIPVIVLSLTDQKVSRLLRGGPAVCLEVTAPNSHALMQAFKAALASRTFQATNA